MMSDAPFEIDYDSESVFYENAWHSRADLAQQIRDMIDRGDYRVARPSAALEALEAGLSGARVLAVRVSPELADAVEEKAGREGRAVSAVIREALQAALQKTDRPVAAKPSSGGGSSREPSRSANTVAATFDDLSPVPTGYSAGPAGGSAVPLELSLGPRGISAGPAGAAALPTGYSAGPSAADSISAGIARISAGPLGVTAGPDGEAVGVGGPAESISAGIASISAGPSGGPGRAA
ncbi:MAG TPA: ribbon-helix-helix domain-containing protein, partial [Vulgatibacter sp.]